MSPKPKNKNSACEAFSTEETVVTVAILAPRATWRLPAQLSTGGPPQPSSSKPPPTNTTASHKGAHTAGGGMIMPFSSTSSLHGALFLVAGYSGLISVYENYCPVGADGEV